MINISKPKSKSDDYTKSKLVVWSQITATLAIDLAGLIFTYTNYYQQESNRKSMMATQMMSQREKSETDFRQFMFKPLIEQVLDDSLLLQKRVNVFQIFKNNFNDLFNSRALFSILFDKAKLNKDNGMDKAFNDKIIKQLISLARMTNEQQELIIAARDDKRKTMTVAENGFIYWELMDAEENGEKEAMGEKNPYKIYH